MKKLFNLALIGIVAMTMVSCNSLDSKLNKMEKACEAGNYAEAAKIYDELDKEYSDDSKADKITVKQQERAAEIVLKCSQKALKDGKIDDFDIE